MRIPAAALLLLGACGDDLIGGADGVVSGDRLRVRYMQHEDTKIFVGFRDTQLGVDCNFAYVDETHATARCLPPLALPTTFRDAACTEPVVQVYGDVCEHAGAFLASATRSGCESFAERIWYLGALGPLPRVYRSGGDDPCEEVPTEPSERWYSPGAEVSMDAFVAARVELDGGSSRLRRESFRADDGARATASLRDTDLDVTCLDLVGDTATCTPPHAVSYDWYDDGGCATPVAAADRVCDAGVAYIVDYDCTTSSCASSLYARGEPVSLSTLYNGNAGACLEGEPLDGYDFFYFGASVPAERLASATRVLEDDQARVSQYEYVATDGFRARAYGIHDADLDRDCDLYADGIDGWRCLPATEYVDGGTAYRDAACTDPVRVAYRTELSNGLDNTVVLQDVDTCVASTTLRTITPQPISPLYLLGDTGCFEWQVDPTTYHEVADALPMDAYALFRDVVE